MRGFAKLRIHTGIGEEVSTVLYSKPFLQIGRSENPSVSDEIADDDPVIQKLHLPGLFAGVSREHAELSWSDTQNAFCLKVLGRNGCIVNRRRYLQGESAFLAIDSVSTFSLGKNCMVYFAPAKYARTIKSMTPISATSTDVDWAKYVIPVFETSDVDCLPRSLLLNSIQTTHPDIFEGALDISRKRTLTSFLRKSPFRTDPAGLVHYSRVRDSPSSPVGEEPEEEHRSMVRMDFS